MLKQWTDYMFCGASQPTSYASHLDLPLRFFELSRLAAFSDASIEPDRVFGCVLNRAGGMDGCPIKTRTQSYP